MSSPNSPVQRAFAVFTAVLDRDEQADWSVFLAACGDDPELIEAVRDLYESDRAFSSPVAKSSGERAKFLRTRFGLGVALDVSMGIADRTGTTIDGYELLERIGTGGMGDVYRARNQSAGFDHDVALKLTRPIALSEDIRQRFESERALLARLKHPNIAALYAGGTTPEGAPYFVLELVDGQPIDEYCRSKALSLPEVLRLFRTVCDAVQYAHSRLIVHRDIKPGNVLVDASGRIKLLDFGIAKQLTTDGGNQTRVGHAAFTPDFASPEQLLGESVTTASDVYSLGVLLFSLLTGAPPHDVRSARPAEVVELATRVTAPRLAQRWVASTGSWSGAFSEDLESILAKALEKEVARRYQSAHELSEDLRRYLEGLPVLARPNSWRYRAAKFVRRHRVGVSAAVAVGLVLMGTTLIALQQLSVARVERDRAARANEFLFDVLLSPSSGVQSSIAGGVDLTVMELLALLPDEIQSRFADDPEEQMRMLNAIGLAQLDSGRYKEGERVVRMAERLAECCIDGLSPSRPYLLNLQFVLARELDPESAGAYIEEAVALREQVSGLPEFINVGILHNYGLYLLEAGRLDEAETFIRRAIAANGNPRNAQLKGLLAVGLGNLSFVARSKGEYVAALDLVRRSIAVFEDLGEVTTQEHVFQYHNMSQLEWRLGNYEAGLEHSRRAVLELDRITGGDHPYLFLMMSNYALHLLATGLFDEAREVFAKAEAAVALPKEHYLRLNLYLVGGELALLSMDAGRARELFESGIRLYKSHKRLDVEALSWLLSGSGLAEYLAGNTELAVQKTRSALELVGVDRARNSPAATIFEKRLNCMQLSLPKATCMVQGVRRIGEADVPSGIERAQQLAELNEREIET